MLERVRGVHALKGVSEPPVSCVRVNAVRVKVVAEGHGEGCAYRGRRDAHALGRGLLRRRVHRRGVLPAPVAERHEAQLAARAAEGEEEREGGQHRPRHGTAGQLANCHGRATPAADPVGTEQEGTSSRKSLIPGGWVALCQGGLGPDGYIPWGRGENRKAEARERGRILALSGSVAGLGRSEGRTEEERTARNAANPPRRDSRARRWTLRTERQREPDCSAAVLSRWTRASSCWQSRAGGAKTWW